MKQYIRRIAKSSLVWLLLLGLNSSLFAQEQLSSLEAQNKTYQLYTQGNWKELVQVGKQALANGYDFYFMRMRVGVGYYSQKKYRLAEAHFKAALDFNSQSDLAQEYLYYCYVFTGRNEEARKLSKSFSLDLRNKTQTKSQPAIEHVFAEFATKVIEDEFKEGNNETYFDNATNFQIGLKHFVKNNFSLTHAFTSFKQASVYGEAKQTQYYVGVNVPLKGNWSLQPTLHLVSTNFTTSGLVDGVESIDETKTAYSLQVKKGVKNVDFILGGTISKVVNLDQKVLFGGITYAPFANSKWLLGFTGYAHKTEGLNGTKTSFAPFTYVELGNNFSVKVNYLVNNESNVIEDNGYFVNNSIGTTTNRLGVQLNAFTNQKFSLYGIYQIENKEIPQADIEFGYNLFLLGTKYYF